MKILHIVNSVDPAGGGPIEGIRQIGTCLVTAGNQVEIASLDSPLSIHCKECPLPVHPLGPSTTKYAFSDRLIPWLRANRKQYDAVVVNGIWQFHSYATWVALSKSNTPYFVFTHGMLDPWFKKRYPLKHAKKWLYWPWAEYRVLRDAQAVLFTCEEERILARESFWLYRCNELVVNYGTATIDGNPKIQCEHFFNLHPHLRGKRLALFMGRIHPKKGCDLLIDAFARTLAIQPLWHLVMAGPDQVRWQEKLQDRARELGIASQITWTGMMSGPEKLGALHASEIFVLPSHQENFGIAVAEALAAGVPVLISDKVNIWREIQADGAGIVAKDNLSGICDLLHAYQRLPKEQKGAMRDRARECFERRFEIKGAAASLEAAVSSRVRVN